MRCIANRARHCRVAQGGKAVVSLRASRYRRAVQVIVNDEPRELGHGATVADLVQTLGFGSRRLAVELNRAVVARAEYSGTVLRDGDQIEIIHFVGGG